MGERDVYAIRINFHLFISFSYFFLYLLIPLYFPISPVQQTSTFALPSNYRVLTSAEPFLPSPPPVKNCRVRHSTISKILFIRVTKTRDAAARFQKLRKRYSGRSKYVLYARAGGRYVRVCVCVRSEPERGGKEWSVWLNRWIRGGQRASLRNPESNISMFSNQ